MSYAIWLIQSSKFMPILERHNRGIGFQLRQIGSDLTRVGLKSGLATIFIRNIHGHKIVPLTWGQPLIEDLVMSVGCGVLNNLLVKLSYQSPIKNEKKKQKIYKIWLSRF